MKYEAKKNVHHQAARGSGLREVRVAKGSCIELDENDADVRALVASGALVPEGVAPKPEPKAPKPGKSKAKPDAEGDAE